MKKLFILLMLLPSALSAQYNCDLGHYMDSLSVEAWKEDSLTSLGFRGLFYKTYFYDLPKGIEKIPFKGRDMDCIKTFFGEPNLIYEEDQIHVYYLSVDIFFYDGEKTYEGLILKFSYRNNIVIAYSIMIACK